MRLTVKGGTRNTKRRGGTEGQNMSGDVNNVNCKSAVMNKQHYIHDDDNGVSNSKNK